MSPTSSKFLYTYSLSTSLEHNNYYFNTQFKFTTESNLIALNAKSISANISWYCEGCPSNYESLNSILNDIYI